MINATTPVNNTQSPDFFATELAAPSYKVGVTGSGVTVTVCRSSVLVEFDPPTLEVGIFWAVELVMLVVALVPTAGAYVSGTAPMAEVVVVGLPTG